jgi:hypothetical protein
VQMQEHVATACKRCQNSTHLWVRFHHASQNESRYRVSDGTVRSVNAAFTACPAKASKNAFARLLFDSSRQPILPGIRSAGPRPRHVLYGFGPYRIDVRIETQLDSDQVAIVGQILNSLDPDEKLGDLKVTLVKSQRELAGCLTNRSGEFQIECALDRGCRVCMVLPSGQEIGLPLINPSGAQLEAPLYSTQNNRFATSQSVPKRGTGKEVWIRRY